MQLRPRQSEFVDRFNAALITHGNTLGVAPTGGGKTVMIAAIATNKEWGDGPVCILQHRDELVSQNRKTLYDFDRHYPSDVFVADRKRWESKGATFAMAQTLSRADNLATTPPLGALFIDEAHHAASDSYLRIIDHVLKLNPKTVIGGFTATPNRGDKKALKGVFTNCADQIMIKELIDTGFLVKPRTFVIDLGVTGELRNVRRTASDFDMTEVEKIMDHKVLNDRVVAEWKQVAGDRQTTVFCSTVAHATHVATAFRDADIKTAMIYGDMPDGERRDFLADFDRQEIQVIVNVAVLTEGWDCQPVSCIVLLRPSSYKSTMIQMIGRGLRKVDPERYPGIHKDDCIVLDFGTSILIHGSIEQEIMLEGKGTKTCPECGAIVPSQCQECPICGEAFPNETDEDIETKECKNCSAVNPIDARVCFACGEPFVAPKDKSELHEFKLSEIDLLNLSPYKWESMFGGLCWIACAIEAWAIVLQVNNRWIALGGKSDKSMRILADNADQLLSLTSADDFLREDGNKDIASKTNRWLQYPPTEKQLSYLHLTPMEAIGMSRYRAACSLQWIFNEKAIRRRIEDHFNPRMAA